MPTAPALVRIASLKSVEQFRAHVLALGVEIPCDDNIQTRAESVLAQPVPATLINGRSIGNRIAIHPMEGWDAAKDGSVTDEVSRRWQRFGASGAKLICGGEAMAVRPEGRANPRQLVLAERNLCGLAELVRLTRKSHRDACSSDEDLVIGFQLTHSGRFCRPTENSKTEPRVAFRHPILDRKFGVTSDDQVITDAEVEELVRDFARAAGVARRAGADFVDIKHCHGYLLHEFLGAHERSGRYGGSFENRTRILREVVASIRAGEAPIDIGVRLSAFDGLPFRADPQSCQDGKHGVGIPEDFSSSLPYRFGFGMCAEDPLSIDLTEPLRFVDLCRDLRVKILNISGGSPYYNPHIQRPAAYPPSDGYQPPEDPLVGVARQMGVARRIMAHLRSGSDSRPNEDAKPHPKEEAAPVIVGSAYSYLQRYLPHVAQAAVRAGWTDMVGMGRMALSYPDLFADAFAQGTLRSRLICRTFSDCTTAPRNGLVSGCYPLDPRYAQRPEAARLKEIKKLGRARI